MIAIMLSLFLFVGAYFLSARQVPQEPITRPGLPVALSVFCGQLLGNPVAMGSLVNIAA
jgi:hypothetical protein